jgi:hypothetical protein
MLLCQNQGRPDIRTNWISGRTGYPDEPDIRMNRISGLLENPVSTRIPDTENSRTSGPIEKRTILVHENSTNQNFFLKTLKADLKILIYWRALG